MVRARTSKVLGLTSHASMLDVAQQTPIDTPVVEAIKNAAEAGAKCIRIFPDSSGNTCVFDDGCGIPYDVIQQRIGALGDSSKKVGATNNFGLGITLTGAAHNPEGFEVVSWTKGAKQAGKVCVGINHENMVALFGVDGDETVARVAKPTSSEHGTVVTFRNLRFDPDRLATIIGDHFQTFVPVSSPGGASPEVFIHRDNPLQGGGKKDPYRLLSLVERAASLADKILEHSPVVTWETPHGIYTAILLAQPHRILASVYEVFRGEVCEYWEAHRGGVAKQSGYGIWAGHSQVCLIVERRNPEGERQVVPDLLRQGTMYWDGHRSQEEARRAVPESLQAWMTKFENANYGPDNDAPETADALKRWGTGTIRLEDINGRPAAGTGGNGAKEGSGSTVSPGGSSGGRGGSGGGGGGSSGATKPKRPPKARPTDPDAEEDDSSVMMGAPEAQFVAAKVVSNTPGAYVPGRNKILISRDFGVVAALLKQADDQKWRPKDVRKLRGLIKAHAISGVANLNRVTGRLPGANADDMSMYAILASPSAAMEFASNLGRRYGGAKDEGAKDED